jgi:hypothetical protein
MGRGRRLCGAVVTAVSLVIMHERARLKQKCPMYIVPSSFN